MAMWGPPVSTDVGPTLLLSSSASSLFLLSSPTSLPILRGTPPAPCSSSRLAPPHRALPWASAAPVVHRHGPPLHPALLPERLIAAAMTPLSIKIAAGEICRTDITTSQLITHVASQEPPRDDERENHGDPGADLVEGEIGALRWTPWMAEIELRAANLPSSSDPNQERTGPASSSATPHTSSWRVSPPPPPLPTVHLAAGHPSPWNGMSVTLFRLKDYTHGLAFTGNTSSACSRSPSPPRLLGLRRRRHRCDASPTSSSLHCEWKWHRRWRMVEEGRQARSKRWLGGGDDDGSGWR